MPTARSSPPVVQLAALLNAANAVHGETETVQDLRFLLGQGSPLGGARPKSAVALPDGQLAIAKFPKPDDVRDIAAGEILALTLDQERLRTARRREGRHLWRSNLTDPDPQSSGRCVSALTQVEQASKDHGEVKYPRPCGADPAPKARLDALVFREQPMRRLVRSGDRANFGSQRGE